MLPVFFTIVLLAKSSLSVISNDYQYSPIEVLEIISNFINKKYTVEEFIHVVGINYPYVDDAISFIKDFANYFKFDFDLTAVNDFPEDEKSFFKGFFRVFFGRDSKDIESLSQFVQFINLESGLIFNWETIDLLGFDGKFQIPLSEIITNVDILRYLSQNEPNLNLTELIHFLVDEIAPLFDLGFDALNLPNASLLNLFQSIIKGGWSPHSLFKELQLDLEYIYGISEVIFHFFSGNHSSVKVTPQYIHETWISPNSTKLKHVFEIYEKFSKVNETIFETTFIWDAVYTTLGYVVDLLKSVKDQFLGGNITNFFGYYINGILSIPEKPFDQTIDKVVKFFNRLVEIEEDNTTMIHDAFHSKKFAEATEFFNTTLIPFFLELKDNINDTSNFTNMLHKYFYVNKEEFLFWFGFISNITSNKHGILDVFQMFLGNGEDAMFIDMLINDLRDIVRNFGPKFNLTSFFGLFFEKYQEPVFMECYYIFVESIKNVANPNLPFNEFLYYNLTGQVTQLGNNIKKAQENVKNFLESDDRVYVSQDLSIFLTRILEYINVFRTKPVKQYLRENNRNVEANEVTTAGEVIINIVRPFFFNVSKLLNLESLMKFLLDDFLHLDKIGQLMRDTDFDLREALNLYIENLGDILEIVYYPLQKIISNSTIIDILKSVPTSFCDIGKSLERFSNLETFSVFHLSTCLVNNWPTERVRLNISQLIPIYRIFYACYALTNYSITNSCYLCQLSQALDWNLSWIDLLIYSVRMLDETSCREYIQDILEFLTFDGPYWDNWLGRIHVLATNIANEESFSFELPFDDSKREQKEIFNYGADINDCDFEVNRFDPYAFLGIPRPTLTFTNTYTASNSYTASRSFTGSLTITIISYNTLPNNSFSENQENNSNKINMIIGIVVACVVVIVAVVIGVVLYIRRKNKIKGKSAQSVEMNQEMDFAANKFDDIDEDPFAEDFNEDNNKPFENI
ncbi:hypothetical protein GPJ56_010914 [Histomonas meleagridis]|uniref:uncharacterized protein n=1 Tax=Histomonas meleagridis TaxID=135588 RepID=UPI00355998F9|nr:hypothetical protein GPJ56_010914 [Histomonas meleagridis]KAH0806285.1 hypothetical protein GO595_000973 [Histomonas meleagridis]